MNPELVHTHEFVKRYRMGMGDICIHALSGVTGDIAKGEFVAIMGPSGSGKSTFVNVLDCLDRPMSGEYRLGGELISEMGSDETAAVRTRHIGFVFQWESPTARPWCWSPTRQTSRASRAGSSGSAMAAVVSGEISSPVEAALAE